MVFVEGVHFYRLVRNQEHNLLRHPLQGRMGYLSKAPSPEIKSWDKSQGKGKAGRLAYVSKASRLTPFSATRHKSKPGRLAYVSKASRLTFLELRGCPRSKPGRLAY